MARIGGIGGLYSMQSSWELTGWELIAMEGCTIWIHGCNFCYRGVFNA